MTTLQNSSVNCASSEYLLTIDDMCLNTFIDTVIDPHTFDRTAIWIIQETTSGKYVEFLFGNYDDAIMYLNAEYYGGTHKLLLTKLNCNNVDDYVILENYEVDEVDDLTTSLENYDEDLNYISEVTDTDLFDTDLFNIYYN